MDFLTSTILSGLAWDGIKSTGKITVEFLKEKLRGWLINDNDLEIIVDKVNEIPESYKKSSKFLEAAIDDDSQLLEILNRIQQRQDIQINMQDSHFEKSTVNSGGSRSTFTTTTNNYYQLPQNENMPKTRAELRKEIKDILFENATVFKMYGPTEANKSDMTTQKHEAWRKLAQEMIVPNNDQIIKLLEENINILNEEERETLIQFKIHAKGFKDNQVREERIADYPQFPIKMNDILS
ncbi:hypothetical protein QNH36_23725 [Mesobacillus sp. AQ2]|uniref:hypothetical protein n=1 Tax=Mesobacillus sp. AQ2 TaxID=3043332 RepID=UPI0024C11F04|nr:hypothetical protein [Mesobacillus sp. AQ2]WHX40608.1 hypothetical protein QNH36_23725 [Mesobacillus sp. AQ2]